MDDTESPPTSPTSPSFLSTNEFINDWLLNNNIEKFHGDTSIENFCAERASAARDLFKKERESLESKKMLYMNPDNEPVLLTNDMKYRIRLYNNRKSAHASKVYNEVYKNELSRILNIYGKLCKCLINEFNIHRTRIDDDLSCQQNEPTAMILNTNDEDIGEICNYRNHLKDSISGMHSLGKDLEIQMKDLEQELIQLTETYAQLRTENEIAEEKRNKFLQLSHNGFFQDDTSHSCQHEGNNFDDIKGSLQHESINTGISTSSLDDENTVTDDHPQKF